jgi:hypothetical protein
LNSSNFSLSYSLNCQDEKRQKNSQKPKSLARDNPYVKPTNITPDDEAAVQVINSDWLTLNKTYTSVAI